MVKEWAWRLRSLRAAGYPKAASDKGLKTGALGLVSSIVVGMASTAPAYSLAASLGFVVATTNGDGLVGVKAPAIGALILGAVLMIVCRLIAPAFFRGQTLARRGADDLILAGAAHEPPAERARLGLPDSGMPDIVIAPDRSNLPAGARTVDQDRKKDPAD